MPILFDDKTRTFTLHTAKTTYQMTADEHDRLLHLYYGPSMNGNAECVLTHFDRGFSGNPGDLRETRGYSLDVLPQEYPVSGSGDYRSPALVIRSASGIYGCDLKYREYEILPGKYSLPGLPAVYAAEEEAQTLKIVLRDENAGVEAVLYYGVLVQEDVITRAAQIRCVGDESITLLKAAAANLDMITGEFDLITFNGRHEMERKPERQHVEHKEYRVGSRRGSSSHQYNPLMILTGRKTTETSGICYAMEFVYSGGFQGSVEKDQFNLTRMQMGLAETCFSYPVNPGETFTVPEVIMTCSDDGLRTLSWNLQNTIRDHVIRGNWKRRVCPVLLNSWEACFMDFDGRKIRELADEAKSLGMDMLVLDDGWFGTRDDDNQALGDWYANETKLGGSIRSLGQDIHDKGLLFGIWVEPEMVNENSQLYRNHPDWALRIPGREPVRARNQLVLDFSREEVRDAVYAQISKVLEESRADYLKWDYNRNIVDIYSAGETDQGRVLYDNMLGVYAFLERLRQDFPNLLIEGCSGGGGRFDAGMLYYCPQIWCSDNSDAIDRLRIQYGTSFGYPAETMGAHVSAVPNGGTGRITSLQTRAYVAMSGTFGYELDPSKLTEAEKSEIRKEIVQRNELAAFMIQADYVRLTDPFRDPVTAWGFVSKDRREGVFFAVVTEVHGNMPVNYVCFEELLKNRQYVNKEDGKTYSSEVLRTIGLPVPREQGEYHSYQWHFVLDEREALS